MHTQQTSLKVILAADRFRPCVEYVFRLFARTYGYSVEFAERSATGSPSDAVINYGQISNDNLASEPISGATCSIARCDFFADGGDCGWGTPAAPGDLTRLVSMAKNQAFNGAVQRITNRSADLPLDIVASAFYLLSGYYDWASAQRDQHGRVLSTNVPVPTETWDLPVVNHWFRQLHELVQLLITGADTLPGKPSLQPGPQTICLTHDVDLLKKYRPGRAARSLLKSISAPATMSGALSDFRRAVAGNDVDPYDSFDSLYVIKERVSAPSTFFFLGCGPGPRNGDYNPQDRQARELYTRARMFGDEIALHGSWDSIGDCKLFASEKAAVQDAARVTIRGSRQHYLRFENPETWKCASGSGLLYDSSGGFPDRAGFKYGWSGCFQPFDLDGMRPLPLLEIPLVCMDVTISNYEKIPAELSLERLANLLDAACDDVPGGAFVFLWHNIMADREQFPGYWDTFEYFFSVASGSARFITLAQLCEEYGAPV